MIEIRDTGARGGEENMDLDREALARGVSGDALIARLFGWDRATVTYGYMLDRARVAEWAARLGDLPLVQRPTGGGAVLHTRDELSLSLLWRRGSGVLPDKPRDCYEAIHRALGRALESSLGAGPVSLHATTAGDCAAPLSASMKAARFSACFQEPVCNDVMMAGRKVIGGALRLTREAILYQGSIQIDGRGNLGRLKETVADALERLSA